MAWSEGDGRESVGERKCRSSLMHEIVVDSVRVEQCHPVYELEHASGYVGSVVRSVVDEARLRSGNSNFVVIEFVMLTPPKSTEVNKTRKLVISPTHVRIIFGLGQGFILN